MLLGLVVLPGVGSRVLGQGSEEFSRVIRAVVTSAVILGLLGLAFKPLRPRPWVFGLMPLAGRSPWSSGCCLRMRLHRLRDRGECTLPVLAVGEVDSRHRPHRPHRGVTTRRGWVVSGVCTPTGDRARRGGRRSGRAGARRPRRGRRRRARRATTGSSPSAPRRAGRSRRLHQLAWDLEDARRRAGRRPRPHGDRRPAAARRPRRRAPAAAAHPTDVHRVPWIAKHAVDRLGARPAPADLSRRCSLAIAVAVKLDGGPVFFRQTRVGRRRPRVPDAQVPLDGRRRRGPARRPAAENERRRAAVQDAATTRGSPGSAGSCAGTPSTSCRSCSTCSAASMSLVGPRPPLPREVASYGRDAQRRLLVKPGLTGLWQVSGRSDLSWEESVRLDLRYVENWIARARRADPLEDRRRRLRQPRRLLSCSLVPPARQAACSHRQGPGERRDETPLGEVVSDANSIDSLDLRVRRYVRAEATEISAAVLSLLSREATSIRVIPRTSAAVRRRSLLGTAECRRCPRRQQRSWELQLADCRFRHRRGRHLHRSERRAGTTFAAQAYPGQAASAQRVRIEQLPAYPPPAVGAASRLSASSPTIGTQATRSARPARPRP